MRCDDYCCNHGCNQGRNCPAREACQLPEPDLDVELAWREIANALIGVVAAVSLVVTCLLVSIVLFPLP